MPLTAAPVLLAAAVVTVYAQQRRERSAVALAAMLWATLLCEAIRGPLASVWQVAWAVMLVQMLTLPVAAWVGLSRLRVSLVLLCAVGAWAGLYGLLWAQRAAFPMMAVDALCTCVTLGAVAAWVAMWFLRPNGRSPAQVALMLYAAVDAIAMVATAAEYESARAWAEKGYAQAGVALVVATLHVRDVRWMR